MRRLVILIALAGLLSGCNMVTSSRPLFTKADARGALRLRPGLWVHPDPACAFDPATPAHSWPDCAGGLIVRPGYFSGLRPGGRPTTPNPPPPTDAVPYRLGGAGPVVVQLKVAQPHARPIYAYEALRPVASDDHGRVIEAKVWLVQCGPPAPPVANGGGRNYRPTQAPLPGLVMNGPNCIAHDAGAVINAARASELWAQADGTSPSTIRWVRDPPR
jgi:hypothetical protein